MARDFFVNGPTLVSVKGRSTVIPTLTELGLSEGPIRITPNVRHSDIAVNAFGNGQVPGTEVQIFLSDVLISMALVHFDQAVLATCLQEAMGGMTTVGQVSRTGTRMTNGAALFSTSNVMISLNLTSPVGGVPWRFPACYMTGPPMEFPLGTERSVVVVNWRAIPYTTDPYQGGLGGSGVALWTHVLDS